MALSPEDMQAIGQLLDQRMQLQDQKLAERLADQERRRRRFWAWIIWLTILGTVLSSVFGALFVKRYIGMVQGMVSALDGQAGQLVELRMEYAKQLEDDRQMRMEYDKQLQHDRQMQKDRTEVVARTGYQSSQDQGQFDAGLLRQYLQLFNQSHQASERMKDAQKNGAATAADDEQSLGDVSQSLEQASTLLTQLLLHESDPAHAGSAEHIERADAPKHTAIQQEPDPAPAAPAPGPPAAPQPAH